MDYLRAKILWDRLESVSVGSSDASKEIASGMAYALGLSAVNCNEGDVGGAPAHIGGLRCDDVTRYNPQRPKLTDAATTALAEDLDNILLAITAYFHAAEELTPEELQSRALRLDKDVEAELTRHESDVKELSSQLETVLNTYEEAAEVHSQLRDSLEDAMRRLPTPLNANHAASNDLLALNIETTLLKLSVVRARMHTSLYGYVASSNPNASMASAVDNLYEKLTTQERALHAKELDLRTRLQEYQQLMELIDDQGNGFAQVVEDLATVRRETEDCRKDLRRLGWTES